MNGETRYSTVVLPTDARKIGNVKAVASPNDLLDALEFDLDRESPDASNLRFAADQLKHSHVPVAFPTETVYGLGADATRSAAVRGIYKAKQRPSDNPLIVHFASLKQLRDLLEPVNGTECSNSQQDSIPKIYHPLISRFWPGPLTIILPNPSNSPLAPEVTAGLNTFGARIPRHVLALALIHQANVPVAAPSANASTKPSPTAAEHVLHDLDGRIETILDGGPCDVGVESTVVDGLSDPPLVLRPGGVSIEQLRSCPGWENTQIGYKNTAEGGDKPKAPGMKYRHYSPKAPVILYEAGRSPPPLAELSAHLGSNNRVGLITTKRWRIDTSRTPLAIRDDTTKSVHMNGFHEPSERLGFTGMLETLHATPTPRAAMKSHQTQHNDSAMQVLEIGLGQSLASVARGMFAALRELDRENVDAIVVEGIDESEGETAAAIMNRLRKAADI